MVGDVLSVQPQLAALLALVGPAPTRAAIALPPATDTDNTCTCGGTPCTCLSSVELQPDRVELSDAAASASMLELTEEEQEQVEQLQQRDRAVREHEAAHASAAGGYARGGASFEYQTGPDGKQYAVGGEVQIDVAPVPNDPAATIAKMEVVRAAALAPADPSAQDRRIAAQAAAEISQARAEQLQEQREAAAEPAPGATASSGASDAKKQPPPAITSASAFGPEAGRAKNAPTSARPTSSRALSAYQRALTSPIAQHPTLDTRA